MNASVLFMNAQNMGFRDDLFDVAISGFMGWDDCFDFERMRFTKPDLKAREIMRVLKDRGRFVCCSWEMQEDLTWMEDAILRHYPAILEDTQYLSERPIGYSSENTDAYEIIFRAAGFREVRASKERTTFVSTDEEGWWRQMVQLGWESLVQKISQKGKLQSLRQAIFEDLQHYKHSDGIHFDKVVFFVSGVK